MLLLLLLTPLNFIAYPQYEPNPILPDTLFVALGNRVEIYNDNVAFVRLDNSNYTFDWEYEAGNSDSIKWYWTSDRLGSFNLKFKCYFEGTLVDEETTIVEVLPRVSGKTYNLLTIGNSITAGGFSYQYDEITSNDIDVNLVPYGTRGEEIKHEGHPGWLFETFLGPESPFYYYGQIDINRYLNDNGFPVPDIVKISLGGNDCYWLYELSSITQSADSLITEVREDFPDALILIAMPTLCENSGDGWINNYTSLFKYEIYQLKMRELWEYLLATYSGPSGSQYVQVTYDGLCIDRDEGYPKDSEGIHIDGLHPNELGYRQLSRGISNVLNRYLQTVHQVDNEPPTTPGEPQLTSITDSSINFSWTPSTDNIGVAGYRVFLDDNHIGTSFKNSYIISGLLPGTEYSISVSALDETSNESPRSPPLIAITDFLPDTEAPSIPTGLEITGITDKSITLAWQPSTDNVTVEGYKVFLDDSEVGIATETTYLFSNLNPATNYEISLIAFDASFNESPKSPDISAKTLEEPDIQPPSSPTGIKIIEVTGRNIDFQWSASTDNVSVSGYRIFLNNVENGTSTDTRYNATDLTPSTEYSITIRAFDASSNESPPSSPVVTTTLAPDTIPPSAPTALTVSKISDTSLTLIWFNSADNISVVGYNVYLNGILAGTTMTNSFSITQLAPGETYSAYVTAFDGSGNQSGPSGTIQVTTISPDNEPPSIPNGLLATSIAMNSIGITWNPSTDNVGVSGYNIYANGILKGSSSLNSFTINQLNPGIEYEITVTAFDQASNNSEFSEAITVTTATSGQTYVPPSPELSIVDFNQINNRVRTTTQLSSFGYTELQNFGMLFREDSVILDKAVVLFCDSSNYKVVNSGHNPENLQVLYNFSDISGSVISPISEMENSISLTREPLINTSSLPAQGLKLFGNSILSSKNISITELIDSLKKTNEITLEAWVRPLKINQPAPSNIISLTRDDTHQGFSLRHIGNEDYYNFGIMLHTTQSDESGNPEIMTSYNINDQELQHVVFTRDRAGEEKIYVNGSLSYSGTRGGDFFNWEESYRLELGNLQSGNAPWNGTFYLVAIYNRNLGAEEVIENYNAGCGQIEFTTELSDLSPGKTYHLNPFAQTDQGIVIGDTLTLTVADTTFPSEQDSIRIKIYPNPSDGNFKVYFEDNTYSANYAILRISDLSGQVVFAKEITLSDAYFSKVEEINLSDSFENGFYSLMLIMGSKAAARKLMIQR